MQMNNATEQLMSTLKDGPCTAEELSRYLSYEEICDCDIRGRIRIEAHPTLKDVYYAKDHEIKALSHYVRANWRTITKIVKGGEFKTFPPKFAKAIKKNFDSEKSMLEGELGSMQDDIADIESKIEEYEEFEGLM